MRYTEKKVHEFPVSSRDVTNQTPPGQEYDVIILAQGEFGTDIPAGDGKLANLFLRCKKTGYFHAMDIYVFSSSEDGKLIPGSPIYKCKKHFQRISIGP